MLLCLHINTEVEFVVRSVQEQTQSVVAAGNVMVQPPEVGAVPTLTVNAAVPLLAGMLAAEPPQPAPAIVGAVGEIKRFVEPRTS